ncbi:MAG: polymer-forming cytoskeletal protein [Brevundimonas sp.]|nr:MAG: polymer-forming cytoskeletal protein [Brevundimonas sp.]
MSILAQDVTFTGDIKGNGDVQVDGHLKGELRVGRVIVGETGTVEGNIAAEYVEVRGRVVGSVSAKQSKLVSTAYLEGDITSEQLSIDVGAYFQGRVAQGRRETAATAASAPAAQPAPQPAPQPVAAPQPAPMADASADPGLGIPPAPAHAG